MRGRARDWLHEPVVVVHHVEGHRIVVTVDQVALKPQHGVLTGWHLENGVIERGEDLGRGHTMILGTRWRERAGAVRAGETVLGLLFGIQVQHRVICFEHRAQPDTRSPSRRK